jgi:precorrin-8X/cobalt-precorrin-8 methylmutase
MVATGMDYLKDPDAIYRASFAAIREAVALDALPEALRPLAVRLVHACGRVEVAAALKWQDDPSGAARAALEAGAPVLVDATMVAAGITRRFLPHGNDVICTLGDDRTAALAADMNTTRSAAAVDLWRPHLGGAVVAIGNAPTALFRLLEILAEQGAPRPAAILAFPVGFVGAAESKDALVAAETGVPYVTLPGREGGSALAAAAVNAVCHGAEA